MKTITVKVSYDPTNEPPYTVTILDEPLVLKRYFVDDDDLQSFWVENKDVWDRIHERISENET